MKSLNICFHFFIHKTSRPWVCMVQHTTVLYYEHSYCFRFLFWHPLSFLIRTCFISQVNPPVLFHLALLVAATISHSVNAAPKIFFKSPSHFFSLSFAGPPPTFSFSLFSLSFSCWSIFQICGHDNLSKLNTLDNTDTETISAFRFRLYWLFCCLCFTRRRWLCDFPPK